MSAAWSMSAGVCQEGGPNLHDSTKALRISCFFTGAPFVADSLIVDLVSVCVFLSVRIVKTSVLRSFFGGAAVDMRTVKYMSSATLMDL
jgi:hypothetical protein